MPQIFLSLFGKKIFLHLVKKIFALFLIPLVLLQHFCSIGLQVYYKLNQAYYTERLCENKAKPSLHCHGQCYLSKQLKQAEEGGKKSLKLIKEKEEYIPINVVAIEIYETTNFTLGKSIPYSFAYFSTYPAFDLLRPPCA